VDDEFLDPLTFNWTSMLGAFPAIIWMFTVGNITITNATGNRCVADDKAIYRYMPDIIKILHR
jgi:uncharacterized circularly permuted ATP-grasp superfamily protein